MEVVLLTHCWLNMSPRVQSPARGPAATSALKARSDWVLRRRGVAHGAVESIFQFKPIPLLFEDSLLLCSMKDNHYLFII